jgi:hypothetical protein
MFFIPAGRKKVKHIRPPPVDTLQLSAGGGKPLIRAAASSFFSNSEKSNIIPRF